MSFGKRSDAEHIASRHRDDCIAHGPGAMTVAVLNLRHRPAASTERLAGAYAQSRRAKRIWALLLVVLLCAAILASAIVGEVRIDKLIAKAPNFAQYFWDLAHFPIDGTANAGRLVVTDPIEWFWGLDSWASLVVSTLLIAYCGTMIGALLGFALSFLSAGNLGCPLWLRICAKRFLEFLRTVPEIVFALFMVFAFGVGPLPGIIAIALHTTGALGKQFAEVNENIDVKPIDGVAATGANWFQRVRFAVLPQVAPEFLSYALLRFEINVRGASVMGFVGAGGIGRELKIAIDRSYYNDVSAILVMIFITVVLIDLFTDWARRQIITSERS
jgi:phosphonate transport system permease protein